MYDYTTIGGTLGSHTPIPLKVMKGWLFQQSWLTERPGEQLHPVRWTSISKGQVWNPPPAFPGQGQPGAGPDSVFDTR